MPIPADDRYYSSGLIQSVSRVPDANAREAEDVAVSRFLAEQFGAHATSEDHQWRELTRIPDTTHVHRVYQLYYRGRRVEGQQLKIHYHRDGWVQYATSSWERPLDVSLPTGISARRGQIEIQARRDLMDRLGRAEGRVSTEPVIWIDPTTKQGTSAVEVTVRSYRPLFIRQYIAEEATGRVLEEIRMIRNLDVKVHKVQPDTSLGFDTVSLPNSLTRLVSSFFIVQREEKRGEGRYALVDVDPSPAFETQTGAGFRYDPTDSASYAADCVGGSGDCPNQAFDARNVYYHLEAFRRKLDAYYARLGASSQFQNDPIQVIVNALSVDLNGDGDGEDEVNNAAYLSEPCTENGAGQRCIIFLRPQTVRSTSCGENGAFHNLARESNVIIHEYMHYVTDTVAKLAPGSRSRPNVGDLLHEGYSDYFGASHITELSGRQVTRVGQFAFESCPSVIRDVSQLKPYVDGDAVSDPHFAGLSWASGLWKLRGELGTETTDLLALKSQFFLSSRAGFVEAVEALVKADTALNRGLNVERIRKLFFDELKFVGGQPNVFRDTPKAVVDVGFKSCLAVHRSEQRSEALLSWAYSSVLGLIWLTSVLTLGRRSGRGI